MRNFLTSLDRAERAFVVFTLSLYGVFLLLRWSSGNYYLTDSYEYIAQADWLLDWLDFRNAGVYETLRPVGYPLFLALVGWLPTFGVLVLQTAVSLLNIVLFIKSTRRLNVTLTYWHYVFLASAPAVFIYAQLVMADWMVLLLVNALFYLLIQPFTTRRFACVQLICGVLPLVKPVFYPLVFFNLAYFAVYLWRRRQFTVWLLVPVVVVLSYMTINLRATGYWHYSSIASKNLLAYNLYLHKSATEGTEAADTWLEGVYGGLNATMTAGERNAYLMQAAREELARPPGILWPLSFKNRRAGRDRPGAV